jgi:hypothetical protein
MAKASAAVATSPLILARFLLKSLITISFNKWFVEHSKLDNGLSRLTDRKLRNA